MNNGPWTRPPASGRRGRGPRGGGGRRRLLYWAGGLAALFLLLNWLFPEARISGPGQVLAILTLVTIGSVIVLSLRLRLGEAVRYTLIWGAILGGLAVVYAFRHDLVAVADRVAGSAVPERGYSTGDAMVFERGPDGHFRVRAEVEGTEVTFLVDTGASNIVLSSEDARRVGLDPAPERYFERYYTANGVIMAAPVLLDSVRIGSIRTEGVRASVTQSELGVSLLGMSFLRELSSFRIEGDRLILEP